MLGVTGRGHKRRRNRLMPLVEKAFAAPPLTGRRWEAQLHHPYLKREVKVGGYSQAEARRQAWRVAIIENLAGFRITAKQLVEDDA